MIIFMTKIKPSIIKYKIIYSDLKLLMTIIFLYLHIKIDGYFVYYFYNEKSFAFYFYKL